MIGRALCGAVKMNVAKPSHITRPAADPHGAARRLARRDGQAGLPLLLTGLRCTACTHWHRQTRQRGTCALAACGTPYRGGDAAICRAFDPREPWQ